MPNPAKAPTSAVRAGDSTARLSASGLVERLPELVLVVHALHEKVAPIARQQGEVGTTLQVDARLPREGCGQPDRHPQVGVLEVEASRLR